MSEERAVRLHVTAPPHIAAPDSVPSIMLWVVGALLPSALWAMWNMGTVAVVLFVAAIGSCVGTEWLWNAALKRKQTIGDMSALLTGILLAMTLPPHTPWWIAAAGGVVAIALAKMLFGGLGWNLFNPALVGRAVALLSWLGVMAQAKPFAGGWHKALSLPAVGKYDAINGATRLAVAAADRAAGKAYAFDLAAQYKPLLLMNLEGSLGEVSAGLLILGGLVLIARGIIDWRIPVSYIGSVAVLSWVFGSDPIFNVLAGGVLLGAFFMATDYVTSPIDKNAKIVFGLGCGILNTVTRFYGPMPETTCFTILFMNGLAPWIDRFFIPRTFGWSKKAEAEA